LFEFQDFEVDFAEFCFREEEFGLEFTTRNEVVDLTLKAEESFALGCVRFGGGFFNRVDGRAQGGELFSIVGGFVADPGHDTEGDGEESGIEDGRFHSAWKSTPHPVPLRVRGGEGIARGATGGHLLFL
jgi:hypothetical protein